MKKIFILKGVFFLLILFFIFPSCHETQTAVSCPGASSAGIESKSGDSKKKHISKRQKKAKGQDGFVPKDKKSKRSAKKAEKGKKKERKETKVERKWHLLKKNRAAKNDDASQEKRNSRRNDRKQRKQEKKRAKHPQMGLFPKGHPG